jgi:hypothetical protein
MISCGQDDGRRTAGAARSDDRGAASPLALLVGPNAGWQQKPGEARPRASACRLVVSAVLHWAGALTRTAKTCRSSAAAVGFVCAGAGEVFAPVVEAGATQRSDTGGGAGLRCEWRWHCRGCPSHCSSRGRSRRPFACRPPARRWSTWPWFSARRKPGPGRKAGPQGVVGVEPRAQASGNVGDHMHGVRIALDLHHAGRPHRARFKNIDPCPPNETPSLKGLRHPDEVSAGRH